MKNLIKKANKLIDSIEMGLLTKKEAMSQIRGLRTEIVDKYQEGTDEFIQCISPLIDAHSVAITI